MRHIRLQRHDRLLGDLHERHRVRDRQLLQHVRAVRTQGDTWIGLHLEQLLHDAGLPGRLLLLGRLFDLRPELWSDRLHRGCRRRRLRLPALYHWVRDELLQRL